MILRQKQQELKRLTGIFPVVGVVGPRQVGKTTLVKQYISDQEKKNAVYLDLENPRDLAKLTDPLLFLENNAARTVVIDEIQRMPGLFPVLRSVVDMDRRPGRLVLLGSTSPDLIRDSSESLAGRIAYMELCPFSINEVSIDEDVPLYKHWYRGGFPNAYLSSDTESAGEWLMHFIRTYTEHDLPALGLPANPLVTRKLLTMLAHLHGNLLNMSNLGRALELSSTTINKYLSYLEGAFLVRLLPPYFANIKKRMVKSPKVYIRDPGILHSLLNIGSEEELQVSPMVGNSWEGHAIEQIIQQLPHQVTPWFYRTQSGAECDLVLEKSGRPVMAIEIKYTSTPRTTRSLTQALEDLNPDLNFIITPDREDFMLTEKTRVCGLVVFLEKYLRSHL